MSSAIRPEPHSVPAGPTAGASDAEFRTFFDHLPIGMYRTRPDGRFLDANLAFAAMLGYPDVASLMAVNAADLYADPAERQFGVVANLAKTGLVRAREMRWRRLDGSVVWVRTGVRALIDARGQRVFEGAVEDITETREMQDALAERSRQLESMQEQLVQRERLALLGRVAGSMSHELRNPLGVIKNSVYFLKLVMGEDERVKKHLGIMEREVTTATRIVTDLLDFARTSPPAPVDVAPADLVRDALDRVLLPAAVRVTVEVPADVPMLHVDPDQVRLVLDNLLRTAGQAMPDGGALTVSAAARGDRVRLVVADTGVGIPAENLARVFEPLFTTRARGIGLGLSIARALTESNGGTLGVESAPGIGSRFTLHFPACPEAASA
jgi:PAS domain S-box-containing protein